jgi:diguanylate cyclase (GGDEF)-like protein
MAILIVDDSLESRLLIQRFLELEGYTAFLMAGSADEALRQLGADVSPAAAPVELILMDLQLPGINGIEACRRLAGDERFRDIPVIVVTASSDSGALSAAFAAGAVDYLDKPVNSLELTARVRSVLRLKRETDQRKARESELIEVTQRLAQANRELQRLSSLDGLTGISNRRRFDELLAQEWKRAARQGSLLSVVLVDIDYFKAYNDRYGHLAGDDCLKRVAVALRDTVRRPGEAVARYGGEEFVAILPGTDPEGARAVAESMRLAVEAIGLEHAASSASSRATVSLGAATTIPDPDSGSETLVAAADLALYEAKDGGRNRVCFRALTLPSKP